AFGVLLTRLHPARFRSGRVCRRTPLVKLRCGGHVDRRPVTVRRRDSDHHQPPWRPLAGSRVPGSRSVWDGQTDGDGGLAAGPAFPARARRDPATMPGSRTVSGRPGGPSAPGRRTEPEALWCSANLGKVPATSPPISATPARWGGVTYRNA